VSPPAETLAPDESYTCVYECCWGRPTATLKDLTNLAVQVAIDRLAPVAGTSPVIVSAYLTGSVEEKFIELRMEFYIGTVPSVAANETALSGLRAASESPLNVLIQVGAWEPTRRRDLEPFQDSLR
jgi:hypothetical protein